MNQLDAVQQAISLVVTLGQAIREAGSIPAGTLYSACLGKVDLDTFYRAIGVLKAQRLIVEENHTLRWIAAK